MMSKDGTYNVKVISVRSMQKSGTKMGHKHNKYAKAASSTKQTKVGEIRPFCPIVVEPF
jgi:hypothetical protein